MAGMWGDDLTLHPSQSLGEFHGMIRCHVPKYLYPAIRSSVYTLFLVEAMVVPLGMNTIHGALLPKWKL